MKGRKQILYGNYMIGGVGILIVIMAFGIANMLKLHNQKEIQQKESAGIAYIEQMETKDPLEVLAQIALAQESREGMQQSIEESIEASIEQAKAEKEKKQQMESWVSQLSSGHFIVLTEEEKNQYRNQFSDCVVLGDSMAQAVLEYGFLDTACVVYRRSYTVDRLMEAADVAVGLYPNKIIFFTGLNDCNHFALVEDYIASYEALINYIREKLPKVEIYVCSLLPPNNAIKAYRADLARSEFFDAALKEMCARRGDTYIDTNWMVYQHLYLNDGIHFEEGFYSIWMQYVAQQIKE